MSTTPWRGHGLPAPIGRPLPAWPVLAWLYGLPIYWVTGLSILAPAFFGTVMAALLIHRGRIRLAPGILAWFAFVAWVLVCAVSLSELSQTIGYAQRTVDLAAVGLAMLYYVNAPETLNPRRTIGGFAAIWVTMIVLGCLAVLFPDVRIDTPMARLMPGSLLGNELVRELVQPRLAEVQSPWGTEEPFVRPAAPFPYTNSWGMAYALLTPLMVTAAMVSRSRRTKIGVLLLTLVSFWPAAQTSNRGMFIALGLFTLLLAARYLVAGRVRPGLALLATLAAAGGALAASGVFAAIAERQEYSDTTSGRSSVYAATFEKVLESPLVGWATPKMDVSIGIALGTQGYAWTLMYSYGFVGLALFLFFLARVLFASRHLVSPLSFTLQVLLAMTAATIWFYGLGVTQTLIVLLSAAMLSRSALSPGPSLGVSPSSALPPSAVPPGSFDV